MPNSGLPPGFQLDQAPQPQPQANPGSLPPGFELDEEKYGTTGQQIKAGIEGFGKGLLGPIFTLPETVLLRNAKEQEMRAEVNPGTHYGAEAAGLIVPALLTAGTSAEARGVLEAGQVATEAAPLLSRAAKFTQANALEKIAQGGVEMIGLGGEGAGTISKIGSSVVKGAIENAAFQTGDEISKQILHPDFNSQAAEQALWNVGLASAFGGGVGGLTGSISPLWQATFGGKTNGVLKAITDKVGGIDGVVSSPVDEAISKLGIEVPPEIKASLSNDPEIRQMASTLNQSDTTGSGLKYQETVKKFKDNLNGKMVQILGKDPETITSDFSKAQAGSKIGNTLADEYHEKMGPITESYDMAAKKYAHADLGATLSEKRIEAAGIQEGLEKQLNRTNRALQKATETGDVASAVEHSQAINDLQKQIIDLQSASHTPGVKDILTQKIQKLVDDEAWAGSDDIMKEVNRVLKRIPEIDTVGKLQKEMTTIGNNTASKLPFGQQDPLSRAGGLLKKLLREGEATAIGKSVGSEEGVDALNLFNSNRQNFAKVAQIKDALDSRLHVRGSASNYAKGIRAMATTDGEAIVNRLSGKGDADLLKVMSELFPKTAQAIKEAHVDSLLSRAANSAKGDEIINGNKLLAEINKMSVGSPELKDFIFPKEIQSQLEHIESIKNALTDSSHNFSNTARVTDKLMQHVPGTALGLIAALVSHNPAAALVIAPLTKALGKTAPDAIRLGLLKFLGSNQPIETGAFKMAVDFIHSATKGENAAINAVKATVGAGSKVIPSIPSKEERERLQTRLDKYKQVQSSLMNQPNKTAYYLPDHGAQLVQSQSRVFNYLDSIKPHPQKPGPFDKDIPPDKQALSMYKNALNIAIQPLSILSSVKSGTLVPQDVMHLKNMYPATYANLSKKLMQELTDKHSRDEIIPYKLKQSASLFLGQSLDATFTPMSIMAAQMTFAKENQSPQGQGQSPAKTNKLNTIAKSDMSSDQAREMRRNKV